MLGSRFHETYRGTAAAVIAGFLLAIALFCGSIFTSMQTMRSVDVASASIAANAVPSVLQLSSARTGLRRFEVLIDDLADRKWSTARPQERGIASDQLAAVYSDLSEYFRLPSYEGEKDYWPSMTSHMMELRRSFDDLSSLKDSKDDALAERIMDTRVKSAVDRLDEAIGLTMVFNARRARELAQEIDRSRRTANGVALALGMLSVALSVGLLHLVLGILKRHSDVMERNVELEKARAKELELFSGRIAHDIRGPLGTVGLTLEIVARARDTDQSVKSALQRGHRSLRMANEIINGLYEFAEAAARPPKGAAADVAQVLSEVVEAVQSGASAAGIRIDLEGAQVGSVACSAGVLASIASNIVGNAVKFMRDSPVRLVRVRPIERRPFVRIEFHDTGPGVPETIRERIFEPYTRDPDALEPGLGLGLATVKRLAEAHGGRVWVESEIGNGSVFVVELPEVPAP
jgi:signal transduction histidine kinase